MNYKGKGVHNISRQHYVKLYKLGLFVALCLVIIAGVALCAGLKGVEKVIDNLAHRHNIVNIHAVAHILHIGVNPAPLLAELHNSPHIVARAVNMHVGDRLQRLGYNRGVGVVGRVVHRHGLAVCKDKLIFHARGGGDKV